MKSCIADPSGTPDARLSRRHVLQVTAAKTVLVAALGRSDAWAGATPPVLDGWARDRVDLNQALTQARSRLSTGKRASLGSTNRYP